MMNLQDTTTSQSSRRTSPLRTSFVLTSMPVGGAETLLVNLIARLDRQIIAPEVICLKEAGPLGEELSRQTPVHTNFLHSKWDIRVLWKLYRRFRRSRTDAVVTIGAGDKMFWGRLAARMAGVPVICSALHSTGWPDGVGQLNRKLTPITDAFIAVAQDHAQFLINWEGFPRSRVFMIPNGVDTDRFKPDHSRRAWLRQSLSIPEHAPLVGIVAALREEKNHSQFILAARDVLRTHSDTRFIIVGDGPTRPEIERQITELCLQRFIHLLGTRSDTPELLAAMDVFALTSRNEANPVSILEALSCGVPVVSPNVGSIHETVIDGTTGFLTSPGSAEETAAGINRLLDDASLAHELGHNGREHVTHSWSLRAMVTGYERLITMIYNDKVTPEKRLHAEPWERQTPVTIGAPLLVLPQVDVPTVPR
ncbi:MAG: glycosyltransferase [Pirellulaceae bacterium]|nr:glycosyltransferase [Pirellulaceae bacterium]